MPLLIFPLNAKHKKTLVLLLMKKEEEIKRVKSGVKSGVQHEAWLAGRLGEGGWRGGGRGGEWEVGGAVLWLIRRSS